MKLKFLRFSLTIFYFLSIVAQVNGQYEFDRIPMRDGQIKIFANGINIAWTTNSNFAQDLTNFNETTWANILDAIQESGGNACRWWLHTNGYASPVFDSDGFVTGLNSQTIDNMKKALDMAYERNIVISMCLWSFDMLQPQGQDQQMMKNLLEDTDKIASYIDHALIPILQAVGDHPAVMTWEIFNEPEGMTSQFGWTPVKTQMTHVQRFINLLSGAIHREVPTALVSNGSWNFRASTDVGGFFNYYRDDRLVVAGGDEDGYLDFYQVHFYPQYEDNNTSPFHHHASYWELDKPIVIGEFPADGIMIGNADPYYTTSQAYDQAYRKGYAGAMSWSWSDTQFGGFPTASEGINFLASNYTNGLVAHDSTWIGEEPPEDFITGLDVKGSTKILLYPNPATSFLNVRVSTFNHELFRFHITDLRGKTLMAGRLNGQSSDIQIPNNISKGIYFIRIENGQINHTQKFLIQ